MTLIEVIVAMVIATIAIATVATAIGGAVGARTRQAAGELATAVRYTWNLAAINNKTYALYVDVGAGTYHAAPVQSDSECERVLLNLDGSDGDRMITRYKDTGDAEDLEDDEEGAGMFGGVSEGAPDPKPPGWSSDDDGTAAGKLLNMISQEARSLGQAEAQKAGVPMDDATGPTGPKRVKTFKKNQLGKPKKLPDGVKFGGIVLREGQEPVTEGTVPILFYPHGYTQRALIYVDEDAEGGETFTVEILSLQGVGKVHAVQLDPSEFAEVDD